VALVALRGNGSNLSLTPTAFVSKAATQTMAQKTADVTLSGTVQASGKTAAVHGTGQLDLAGRKVSLNLSASVPGGGAFDEHEIVKILNQPAGEQPVGIGSHDGGPNSDNVCAIGLEEYVLERWLVSEPLQILR